MTYIIIRYYVLSLSNPNYVKHEVIPMLESSLTDKNDSVVAAAAQVFWNWQRQFNYVVPMRVFYLLASSLVVREETNPLRIMLRGVLFFISAQNETMRRVSCADPNLLPPFDKIIPVTRESFVFSHMLDPYKKIKEYKDECNVDLNSSLSELGNIADTLEFDNVLKMESDDMESEEGKKVDDSI